MADYTSKAQIIVTINGKQAEKMYKDLTKQAETLRKKMDAAAKIGDSASVKKFASELKKVERQIRQIEGASESVESVLKRLDKATPRELNKALSQLKKELNGIERGSDAWNKHMQQIRRVKEEMARLNAEMATHGSRWQRLNNWLNNTQTFLMGVTAAITGLIMAGRKAVNSFAEMDEQLANTRKYTGMAVEDVEKLNEAFKRMDTRTPRDKLNELAQEAGRLGLNTLQSVKGYVEAADIIKVALVDLGEGATQTIAKLTNIFGVEKMLGTKQSMLAVGSAVNVLSQNCTASKPYLVEFAQRMAGIGSQAGLTIPQILAFGAVLDANGQKVEMSATAIQKVIMNLANKNREFAKTVGIDAEKLAETLKHSAKDGLIMFLEALQKMGKSVGFENATLTLAPAFKEMGLDAARVSQVLSTLAMHLDEVKWQIGEANKAFNEASSATNEYTIFNNTAQAAIDKAKARVKELAIELGEKLYPIMSHIYTSSGIFLRVLNTIVGFIVQNKSEVLSLCVAIAAYSVAINLATIRTKALTAATTMGNIAMATWNTIVKAFSVVMALCNRNIGEARTAWIALNASLKASVIGVVIGLVALLISKLVNLKGETSEFKKSMDEAMKSSTSFAESAQKEIKEIDKLIGKLVGAEKGTKEYQKAKDDIISKYGVYLKGLISETGEITNLALAYERLTFAAQKSAQARGVANAKESLTKAYYEDVDQQTENLRKVLEAWGMDDRNLTRIITIVSQKLASGQEIPSAVVNEIKDFEAKKRSIKEMLFGGESAVKIINSLIDNRNNFNVRQQKLDRMDDRYFKDVDTKSLEDHIESLQKSLDQSPLEKIEVSLAFGREGDARKVVDAFDKEYRKNIDSTADQLSLKKGSEALDQYTQIGKIEHTFKLSSDSSGAFIAQGTMDRKDAQLLMNELLYELSNRNDTKNDNQYNPKGIVPPFSDENSSVSKEDKFKEEKEWREKQEALNRIAYARGKKSYIDYLKEMDQIEVEYQKKRLKHEDLDDNERLTIRAEFYEAVKKKNERFTAESIEKLEELHNTSVSFYKSMYLKNKMSKEQFDDAMEKEEIRHLYSMLSKYEKGSKEYLDAKKKIQDLEIAAMQKKQKKAEELEKQYAAMKESYFGDNPQEKQEKLDSELAALKIVYDREILAAGNNAAEKLRIDEAYEQAKLVLKKKYGLLVQQEEKNAMRSAVEQSVEWLNSDGGKAVVGSIQTLSSGMSSLFSQLTDMVKSELEIQTAEIEKRYEKEISRAEGNTYRIAKLEKQKEAEIAKAKNEANKKMYSMQVMQAIAQTATGAINAYSSAAAIPVVGYILAPIAAAMAVAAGMVQVANIKKQQAASESAGYAEGGFTEDGDKYKPAGIVHAGEWVASQKLVRNPRVRPILNRLEYAQRNNVEPFMAMDDVSMRLTAPTMIAHGGSSSGGRELLETMEKLNKRLNDPLVSVVTVSGDKGIDKEKKRYDRLMKNKS